MYKVVIIPVSSEATAYPIYFVPTTDSMMVGPVGELVLEKDASTKRIYAPGTWKEVNISWVDDR
jgi:hypothetical protein